MSMTPPPGLSPRQLIQAGAASCAQAVAAGHVTAQALCEAAIAAIEEGDGPINAVVVRDFARARDQALAADALHEQGKRLPLLGVPMTVKESFNVAGLPTSWGLPPFKDYRPETDAVAVQRLKAAGAVILGKTNVPPALADWQCANGVYGRTAHPRDAARTPGGSSGGAAAALAAGFVALELGSDLMGSIRVPAHFCGVWAHKSSAGVLPMRGHVFPGVSEPVGPVPDLPAVIGPLGRSADDLRLALRAMAGAEAPMSEAWSFHWPAPRRSDPGQWEILLLDAHPLATLSDAMRGTLDEAAGRLARRGARITRVAELPAGLMPDLALLHKTYVSHVQVLLSAFEPGATCALSAHEWIHLSTRRAALRAQCFELMQRFDAVLSPPFGVAAFRDFSDADWTSRTLDIDGEAAPYAAQGAWSTLASLAGLPATQVPVRETAQGLPMGVQVIGPWLQDFGTIEIACSIGSRTLEGT